MNAIKKPVKRTKVLFIISELDTNGGAEKNFYDVVLNIDRKKFTPYALIFRGGYLTSKLESQGIPVEVNGVSKLLSMYALKKGLKLHRFLKKEEIQVVVTYHHDPDIWGGLIARLAGIPVVISSRRDMGYQLEKIHIWFYRIFGFLFSSFISVSNAVKGEIETREWVKSKKIEVIHNGIRLDLYSNTYDTQGIKAEFGIDPSKIIIGMLATFRPIKGQLYLVEAVSRIVEKHNNIKVVVVGYNETEYFHTVKRKVEELKLQNYFIFAGERQDASRLLSIFDILVVPSVNEGFSNAILEAMAAGKPVVASDSGGNPEAVEHQKTGLLFKPCDSQSLAEALQQLIEDKGLRQLMGKAGQWRVEQDFQLDKMIKKNEDLYQYHLYKPDLRERFILWTENIKTYYVKKSIKLLLSYILYYSGIFRMLKKRAGIGLKVLAYHSVNKVALKPLEIEQDTRNFEQQMVYLKKNCHILSLSGFIQYMKNGHKYPDNSVLITFDDGYKDNYTNAYPVLKKLNIPAVIFLTIDSIEKNIPLFYDSLRYAIMNTEKKILDLEDWGLDKYALYCNELFLKRIIDEITNYSKRLTREKQLGLIDTIFERLSIDKGSFLSRRSYLTWDEIQEMSENEIEFGAHTMSHPSLSQTSIKQTRHELLGSKKAIEAHTKKRVISFAYPFGAPGDYSSIIPDILNKNNFECAFMLTQESKDRYWIGRKTVDSHMTTKFNGTFCEALFGCEMANIF